MEAPVNDVASLRRRTNFLIVIHLTLAGAALIVTGLIIWRAPLLVTLSQRTNVETLVIAFVLVYAVYLLITTIPATIGAVRLLWYRAMGRERGQRALQRISRKSQRDEKRSYLSTVVKGPREQPIEIPLEDRFGKLGVARIDLAEVAFLDVPTALTHSTMQLVAKTLAGVAKLEGTDRGPEVVFWDNIEEEMAQWYAAQVGAFDRLEKALETKPLWPVARVDAKGVEELSKVLREATPALREALLLPDVEYSAEFTIPVIPEPFALMQLRRHMAHADAIASMGCVTVVTLFFLAVVALVLISPPWVPGK